MARAHNIPDQDEIDDQPIADLGGLIRQHIDDSETPASVFSPENIRTPPEHSYTTDGYPTTLAPRSAPALDNEEDEPCGIWETGEKIEDRVARIKSKEVPTGKRTSSQIRRLFENNLRTIKEILVLIQCGATVHVTCEGMGIAWPTFRRWLSRGQTEYEQELESYYSVLYMEVTKARALCRQSCELEVRRDDPAKYLRYMGRSRPDEGREGWDDQPVNIILGGDKSNPILTQNQNLNLNIHTLPNGQTVLPNTPTDLGDIIKVYAQAGLIELTEAGQKAIEESSNNRPQSSPENPQP